MKTAGIIGGLAPESTIDYYRRIVSRYRHRSPDGSYPSLLIRSIDLNLVIDLVGRDRVRELVDLMADEVFKLALGGADFALIAASTPHLAFDEIRKQSPIPLVSIVDSTVRAVAEEGLRRVGIVGTLFTMLARFYPDALRAVGAVPILPSFEDQQQIHRIYMNELLDGLVRYESKQCLLRIIRRMRADDDIDGLILAGTALPLLVREPEHAGVVLLDAAKLHVEDVVTEMLRL